MLLENGCGLLAIDFAFELGHEHAHIGALIEIGFFFDDVFYGLVEIDVL